MMEQHPAFIFYSLLLLFVVTVQSIAPEPNVHEIFVDPNGRDDAAGTLDQPVSTLAKARDIIREIKSKFGGTLQQPVNVYLRSGRYQLEEPFVLEAQDTGFVHAPITYQKYPGDEAPPVVSGGIVLTGWSKSLDNPKIWQTKVPNVTEGFYPKQFWVNEDRKFRARLPSLDSLYYWTDLFNGSLQTWGFLYNSSDKLETYYNLNDVSLVMFHSWTASHHSIDTINQNNHTLYFLNPTDPISVPEEDPSGRRYFIENVLEGLDEPGEWYLDRTTGLLSYYAQPHENLYTAVTIVSNLDNLLEVKGDSDTLVQYLTIQDIVYEHSEWHCPPLPQPCDGQAADFMNTSAIYVVNAADINFQGVTILHTGTTAIWLVENVTRVMINNIYASDLGAGGVRIGSSSSKNVSHNTVQNSYLLNGGQTLFEGIGVLAQLTSYNTITHNEIGHFTYTGISVGWSWGYKPSSAHNNTVSFNHIYDIGKNTLSDMGGIYTLGVSPGSVIDNNLIHDVYSYNYGGWGLYPDEGSSEQVWSNNIVYNTKSGGLHHHYGENNTITNNIFAFTGWFDGSIRTDPGLDPSSLAFTLNIVYTTNASLFNGDWEYRAGGSNYNRFFFNKNVYFQTQDNYRFGDNLTITAWRAAGEDRHSKLTDPLFTDVESYDFSLRSSSPALALGFKQIDTSSFGPQPTNHQVHWLQVPSSPTFQSTSVSKLPHGRERYHLKDTGEYPIKSKI